MLQKTGAVQRKAERILLIIRVGRLKVSFFEPFYGAYNIIAPDKVEYQYVMIAGNTTDYLWILVRTSALEKTILKQLVQQANMRGFPTQDLIYLQPQDETWTQFWSASAVVCWVIGCATMARINITAI
jgi:hypothetical protein